MIRRRSTAFTTVAALRCVLPLCAAFRRAWQKPVSDQLRQQLGMRQMQDMPGRGDDGTPSACGNEAFKSSKSWCGTMRSSRPWIKRISVVIRVSMGRRSSCVSKPTRCASDRIGVSPFFSR